MIAASSVPQRRVWATMVARAFSTGVSPSTPDNSYSPASSSYPPGRNPSSGCRPPSRTRWGNPSRSRPVRSPRPPARRRNRVVVQGFAAEHPLRVVRQTPPGRCGRCGRRGRCRSGGRREDGPGPGRDRPQVEVARIPVVVVGDVLVAADPVKACQSSALIRHGDVLP